MAHEGAGVCVTWLTAKRVDVCDGPYQAGSMTVGVAQQQEDML